MLFFFSSRRRHTRCALVTGVQTCALPIWLLDDVKAGRFDVIVLDSLTRLSRHPADLHPLHRLLDFIGIKLVTVDVGDISLLHVGILATMTGLRLESSARETHRNQVADLLRRSSAYRRLALECLITFISRFSPFPFLIIFFFLFF